MYKKYSREFKIKVIKEYLETDLSYESLAKKYNISSKNRIYEWVCEYKRLGESACFTPKHILNSSETILHAVELYMEHKYSYMEIADILSIRSPQRVMEWVSMYCPKEYLKTKKQNHERKVQRRIREKAGKRAPAGKNGNSHFKRIEEAAFRAGSSEQKARIIHSLRAEFKLKDILAVTGYSKSTYMYWQKRFDRENKDAHLEAMILKIHDANPDYGYRRIYGELSANLPDEHINIKRVHRLTKKLGIQVKSYTRKTRKYSSYKGILARISPNRIRRRFETCIIHQKIATDTTEFKYYLISENGERITQKLYLDPFMDMYNREIISYSMSASPSGENIMTALQQAITITSDCKYRRTFHSDRGWGYQMNAYRGELKKNKIFQSMSRKGNCLDNSVMENFFGLLKQEIYYGKEYHSYESLKKAIEDFIEYYNNIRIKEKLGWLSPVNYRIRNTAA